MKPTPITLGDARLPARFWAKVEASASGCWLWTGALGAGGYGLYKINRTLRRAHRIAFEALVGPVPIGLELDHTCNVRNCLRPDHLEPVTHAENMRRSSARQTHCRWGHEYTPDNTIRDQNGWRSCRECRRVRSRARRAA